MSNSPNDDHRLGHKHGHQPLAFVGAVEISLWLLRHSHWRPPLLHPLPYRPASAVSPRVALEHDLDRGNVSHGRVAVRPRVLKNATIVFRQGYSTMPCGVLDLSDEGARLLPALPWFCPKEFILKFDVGGSRNCQVIWRREAELGVQFFPDASSINSHAPATKSTAVIDDKPPVQAVELARAPLGLREAFVESIIAKQGDPQRGALAVMSISNLGVVKTAYGAETAAIVFGTVEQRLQKVLRGLDVMGRLGDDKFGIVLAHCKPEHASTVADRFVSAVQSGPIVTRDALICVELSTSIKIPSGNKSLFDLIESAGPLPKRLLLSSVIVTEVPPLDGPQNPE